MKRLLAVPVALAALFAGGATRIVQDQCGPFTDVTPAFCPYVTELYYLGITAGTSPTTFSPDDLLTRGQGAVFVAKGLNQSLARSSRRAAPGQWWTTTPHWELGLGLTAVQNNPELLQSDGSDIWVANNGSRSVSRVRASDGKLLDTWTGARDAVGVLIAMGRVFVTAINGSNGFLYMIDPTQPAGTVTIAAILPPTPYGVAFDGARIWTANLDGSVSIVTPAATLPWPVTTVTGFVSPFGAIFDGTNVWVTDTSASALLKLDATGVVLQTVPTGLIPGLPVFDGANIWVPNSGEDSITVVQASTGTVLATLAGNGLFGPLAAGFDGQRILVTNRGHARGDPTSGSLFQATDLSALGTFPTTGLSPWGVCSDGINFWVSFNQGDGKIGRF